MVQAVFLVSVLAGVASLVAAISVTRFHWRSDIAPYSRQTSAFKVLARPQSYAMASALGVIRTLTLIGYGLLAVAILCIAYQLLNDLSAR